MRLIKRLLILLLILFGSLLVVAFFMPARTGVSRSIVIERPASMVFAMVNSFRRFNDWSPWSAKDPKASVTRSGPDDGVGAHYAWKGNSDVGEGSQHITASEPFKRVDLALDFGPMGQSSARYELAPAGQGTQITWSLEADLPLRLSTQLPAQIIGRLMGPWISTSVGKDYDQGLAKLKLLLEGIPSVDLAAVHAEVGQVTARPTYFIATESALDEQSTSAALLAAIGDVGAFGLLNGLEQQGPPRAVIVGHNDKTWQFEATIPYDRGDVPPLGPIQSGHTHEGKVVLFQHSGPIANLGDTHRAADTWLAVHGYQEIGRRSEIYISDPQNTAPAEQLTIIEVPVAPSAP